MRRLWRVLRWIGGGLFVLVLTGALVWFGGLGPRGPIAGGVLWGEEASELPLDWSFVDSVAEVQVETYFGPLPWSVTTWVFSHQGRLYLAARNCLTKRWVKNVMANSNVRVRIDRRIYPLRATRDSDPEIGTALLRQMLHKYLGIEAADARAVDDTPATGETRAYGCYFRLEARS